MKTQNLPISAEMITRAVLQSVAGVIPFAGGLLSAAISLSGEMEQNQTNQLMQTLISAMGTDLQDLAKMLTEVNKRLNFCEKKVLKRVQGKAYQSQFMKIIKRWGDVDTKAKRIKMRNILINSALRTVKDDDKINQYINWTMNLSEIEVKILAVVAEAGESGITRKQIWLKLGNSENPREVSRKADFFRLALRKLQEEEIVRVKRQLKDDGTFAPKDYERGDINLNRTFDDKVLFRLTNLGREYVDFVTDDMPLVG